MRIRKHREEAHESSTGIDLAPMLDFVTNLLIFFIITAVFVKESALTVSRPTAIESKNQEEAESIQIQILSNGEVWIDNRVVDVRAVRANVERMSAVNSKAGVTILADQQSPTGIMVEVVDQVHLGGIDNIMFTTSN